jgi:hypothetical protein
LQVEAAAQVRDALFHAQQAEAARVRAVEALPVVEHAQVDAVAFLHDLDAHAAREGVPGAVVQRFLHHAIDTGFVLFGQIVGHACRPPP